MKATLECLDVCYPDYFTGYHRPVITIPVFNNITCKEVAQSIIDEMNSAWDYYTNEDNGFSKTELLIIDEYVRELKLISYDEFIGEEFEEEQSEDYSIYAHFSICRMKYVNGMSFLS